MNEIKRNIRRAVLTLAIALPMTATASPAYRGVVTVEEPDGTVLELRVHGEAPVTPNSTHTPAEIPRRQHRDTWRMVRPLEIFATKMPIIAV